MEPSRSENIAHLQTVWEQYSHEGTEENLNQMMGFIERIQSDFTPENAPILQNIQVTLIERHAPPEYVERVKNLASRFMPEGAIQALPEKLKKILATDDYSSDDLKSLVMVKKEYKEIIETDIARRIELCRMQPTAEVLIGALKICQDRIYYLDLHTLLKNQPPITQEQLKQILELCPFLRTLVIGDLDRQSFWPGAGDLTPPTILVEHFSKPPASQSLQAFALIAPSLGWDGNYKLDTQLKSALEAQCPNMKQFSVDCVLTREGAGGAPYPPSSLEPWLKKGKSIFRFKELFLKIVNLSQGTWGTPKATLLYLVPPDWFLNLKEARQQKLLEFAEPLSKMTPDEMDAFAAMSEVEQDLKLT